MTLIVLTGLLNSEATNQINLLCVCVCVCVCVEGKGGGWGRVCGGWVQIYEHLA